MSSKFLKSVKGLEGQVNVTTLDMPELASRARPSGTQTTGGSLAYFSNVRSRSASQSVAVGSGKVCEKNLNGGQEAILSKLDSTLDTLREYLQAAPIVCVKRAIGDNDTFNPECTLYLSTRRGDNTRLAYLWANTLRDHISDLPGPELNLVCIPEWPEHNRQVLVFPEDGLTVVLGMDYVGEVKMGFLRMAMWFAKQQRMLSLYAGSKIIKARQKDGTINRYGVLLFGLSGTGKTTHSCHDHGLDGEGIEVLQDDIVFLREDGSALGVEQGFYLKTEGITRDNQAVIYEGLAAPETLLENVMVDYQGNIDFNNLTLGSNGRAVMPRVALSPHVSETIDLPPLDEMDGLIMAFVTRRMTVLPIASKLTPEQATATFMLGESIETSAGDPRRAGESVRVVGTNPFLIGDEAEEGNWFYDFLKRHQDKVQCYLLNTGGVGEIMERDSDGNPIIKQKTLRVEIPEMSSIIREIARGTIVWEQDPHFGTLMPAQAGGVDIGKFCLENFYSKEQATEYAESLKQSRREWISRFSDLQKEIAQALP